MNKIKQSKIMTVPKHCCARLRQEKLRSKLFNGMDPVKAYFDISASDLEQSGRV